ncbi:MAG: glycosyltransferase [Betaproteobacteria bacterium]|nr:glycosyltransferase [Betaproteobacteria bacterium]
MRVLLVSGTFPPMRCGVGAYTAALAKALARIEGLNVGVLTSEEANPHPECGVEVLTLKCDWGWRDLPRLLRAVRDWLPDLVHVQYPTQAYGNKSAPWILPAVLRMARIPTVQTWHEFMPRPPWLRMVIALAASRVIVVRPNYESRQPLWFLKMLGGTRLDYIPNASPIDLPELGDQERLRVRARYAPLDKKLVVYFGFIYPHKGVEQMFEIADPGRDQLIIAGHIDPSTNSYHRELAALAGSPVWRGASTLAGFLADQEAWALLASADAVVFPFRDGMGPWNTSVAGVRALGTFVIVTSKERRGYEPETNTYFSVPNDITGMRAALREHAGRRIPVARGKLSEQWRQIAEAHHTIYRNLLGAWSST